MRLAKQTQIGVTSITTTQAMVLEKFNEPLVCTEVTIPRLGEGQLLVRILASGVCGSDLHMRAGKDARTRLPIILGHEGVGIIEDIGGNNRRTTLDGLTLSVGDFVTWNRSVSCGHCYHCSVLRTPSLCPSRWVYGIHTCFNDPPHLNGCFSNHIILSSDTDVFRLSPSAPPERVVSASCSGATIAHGFELCPPELGSTVLVQGPGPLGLYATAFAMYMGAARVIVIGGSVKRLDACRLLGADTVINRRQTTVEERKEMVLGLTGGRGVDMVVECAGDPSAVKEGIQLVRAGGTYLTAGFGVPSGTVEIDCFSDIVRRNLRLQGVWVSDTKHTQMALSLVSSLGEKADIMVSDSFGLHEANEALDKAASGDAVKVILKPSC